MGNRLRRVDVEVAVEVALITLLEDCQDELRCKVYKGRHDGFTKKISYLVRQMSK